MMCLKKETEQKNSERSALHKKTWFADHQQPSPTQSSGLFPVWTPQQPSLSLAPHPQRVEMTNTTLASSAKKENPTFPLENHSHIVHLSMKRAVVVMEFLESLKEATFSPALQDGTTATMFCTFCVYHIKLFHATTLRNTFIEVYPSK